MREGEGGSKSKRKEAEREEREKKKPTHLTVCGPKKGEEQELWFSKKSGKFKLERIKIISRKSHRTESLHRG